MGMLTALMPKACRRALQYECIQSLDWNTGLDYWTGLLDSVVLHILYHNISRGTFDNTLTKEQTNGCCLLLP